MKPIIAITMGDFNGIGPEVALKAVVSPIVKRIAVPILIGSMDVFEYYAKLYKMKISLKEVEKIPKTNTDDIPIIAIRRFRKPIIKPGTVSSEAGKFAVESVITAVVLNLKYQIDGIVTAPISKKAMNLNGLNFPGQTELLAMLYKSNKYEMILMIDDFRVGLVTIHIPLNEVTTKLSKNIIFEKILTLQNSLKSDFSITKPKIAVLGVNPHSGEDGMFGKEEKSIILPAIVQAMKKGIDVLGPFPADGFFGNQMYKTYDAILAMYHDQGLIPLKLMGFDKVVNFSAGLKVVRTSPGHGTAFDLAGKGRAKAESMVQAICSAVKIIKNRRNANKW